MYRIECPAEVARIPTESEDSDSQESNVSTNCSLETIPNLWWDNFDIDNPPIKMNSPTSTNTVVNTADLSDIIRNNTKNNYARINTLFHFCGGRDKHPEFPHLICEKNAVKWLEEIDSRTRDNWDDLGRIELATQYTLGSAHDYIKRVVKDAGTPPSWEEVKRRFRRIYPNEITEDNLRVKLGEAKRGVGETLTDFFIRLDTVGGTLAEKSPTHKEVDTRLVANKFIKCLPLAFRTYIEEDDMKDPTKVFLKAMKLVNNNPQCKLSDADVYRETKQTVNVVVEPNKIPMGARPKQGTNQI
ncbi:hypothetical protein Pmani_027589 [Petrolisthes manimaculis]|uniref:Retrotransposon gag domain-containing protein n=1 Tax=Petrolisthes manimaculis TaxID=1843537 RepID=A0AAE1TWN1_9EUCA|nr:hypothetical protein Pmani_027589 [Petrolisthes manimaculis]